MAHFDLLNYGWSVAQEVREWFKEGDGADNKTYVDGPKAKARNLKQRSALIARQTPDTGSHPRIRAFKRDFPEQMRFPADYGNWLIQQNVRVGNCSEMTWVACHFVRRRHAGTHIWVAMIDDPGDHQFCILQLSEPRSDSIAKMGVPKDECVIVDPWTGIACYSQDFATEFKEKMNKWTQNGKRIGIIKDGRYEWTPGNNSIYLKNQLTSKLSIRQGYKWPI